MSMNFFRFLLFVVCLSWLLKISKTFIEWEASLFTNYHVFDVINLFPGSLAGFVAWGMLLIPYFFIVFVVFIFINLLSKLYKTF
ncbi:hypothetical protein DI392_17940 [Vibrio albus]|uniref:Uncharacterized protein n=1 Tax=Vibrio albus TaxID=2200953 RepID=A0A2U3B530_9VIBR|nr:hypothetical protein DI392_17940 [Vibrio albus]